MIRRALLLAAFIPSIAVAQHAGRTGTIVIAHGGDSLWNSHVIAAAGAARTGGPVEVSFLMGPEAARTRFQDVAARLERVGVSDIVIVPMLVSSHSGHFEQIRYLRGDSVVLDAAMEHHLHMAGITRAKTSLAIRLAPAMDDSRHVAVVLADRASALATDARERAVLIVGHGPNSSLHYAAWMQNLRVVADTVKALGGFRDVRVELVRDDAPPPVRAEAVRRTRELIELQHMATGKDVIVVPVLVSKGSINRDKLPRDLAGMPMIYSGEPLLPHAAMVRWIEDRAKSSRYTVR
jgi:sirohydrochlorin cobaltochelatase